MAFAGPAVPWPVGARSRTHDDDRYGGVDNGGREVRVHPDAPADLGLADRDLTGFNR